MKRITVALLLLLLSSGSVKPAVERASIPDDEFLVIAHRGASAYAPPHTLTAYELAIQMGSDYIELDLHMTKDGKLVALHDSYLTFQDTEQAIADVTFNDLQLYLPGEEFNERNPRYASPIYKQLRIVELEDIFHHFGGSVNYYIELKSPKKYPGIEEELLRQLRANNLLSSENVIPPVIIQSFSEDSLKSIFDMEPSIPLIKLYSFSKDAHLSKKKLGKLKKYASGVGVNVDSVTKEFIESMHKEGLVVHPFTVNDEKTIRKLIKLGANGVFTDKPDIAVRAKSEESSLDAD
ncbi:glycerophosphodiester phosphodiesterase family protein [Sporosarcina sp. JAI121]|uniref:glycerophosphodiester phosphodiesterase family protein n=1 Tax=Sporosarcina sp. JAI121 TaxID=2723064 RepID=UPI0015CE3B8F|nr:glycerophosphodiester phosphodiesterase family protein [Sporosarcina sp. JAI121]NYF23848.1 glycerophosphoryl diester phosphodiesterase [Sporosarcina sp. JAI121]